MSDELRDQINDIIEGEIQNGINEYLEKEGKGFKGQELKVNIAQAEVDKLIKSHVSSLYNVFKYLLYVIVIWVQIESC